ncbi:MAG: CDP-alcohol phosphatidyltransferase family protein [Opitutus sp.]
MTRTEPRSDARAALVREPGARKVKVMRRSHWPNIITISRICLMPVVLTAAITGHRGWFAGLLTVALWTDVLDGYLARRLQAFSQFGRKLDSIADYTALFVGLIGVTLLWPDVVRREWPWFAAVMGSFFVAMIFSFIRLGRAPCYHTWASKGTVAACALSLIPLLAGWTATPAHVVASLQVLVGVEEIAIALMIPWHVGEMPTVWHAWQLRKQRRDARVPASSQTRSA